MKRLALVSVAVAALLLTGCEKKESQNASAPAAQEAVKAEAPKAQAPKPEAKPAAEAPKPAQSEAKPAEAPKAQAATAQKTEAAQEAQKPASATEQAKEAVNNATEAVKEKANEAESKAKEAVAAATSGATAGAADGKGKELYAKCASCHGPKGEKHALGKSAVIAGMAKDELVKKLQGYKAGTLNQYGMGALMKGQVASLSDADIEALADYISKLK